MSELRFKILEKVGYDKEKALKVIEAVQEKEVYFNLMLIIGETRESLENILEAFNTVVAYTGEDENRLTLFGKLWYRNREKTLAEQVERTIAQCQELLPVINDPA